MQDCAKSETGDTAATQAEKGGSIPTLALHTYDLREAPDAEVREFVLAHHYSSRMPRLTKVRLGFYRAGEMRAAITLGYGVRPLHTVKKLWPSLGVADYLEIGKMCAHPDEPKNTESILLSRAIRWLKRERPALKLLFTWADGVWGKPGYVYQAANFFYGGFIKTDCYLDSAGRRVHPRQLRASTGHKRRPSPPELDALGMRHVFGKQFRYYFPLSDMRKVPTTVEWARSGFPKHADLKFWETKWGRKFEIEKPAFTGAF